MSAGEEFAALIRAGFEGREKLTLAECAATFVCSAEHIFHLVQGRQIAAVDVRGGKWKALDSAGNKVPRHRCRITVLALCRFVTKRSCTAKRKRKERAKGSRT